MYIIHYSKQQKQCFKSNIGQLIKTLFISTCIIHYSTRQRQCFKSDTGQLIINKKH